MDKVEKIRAEIERRYNYEKEMYCDTKPDGRPNDGWSESLAIMGVLEELISFIDTLSEETDKSLEEAAEDQARSFGYQKEDYEYKELVETFIAGAEWQKELMMKEAVEGYVNYYEDSGGILMAEAQVGCPYHNGDKVRIIVLPKEEQK